VVDSNGDAEVAGPPDRALKVIDASLQISRNVSLHSPLHVCIPHDNIIFCHLYKVDET
jgi:hypothetical protein